MDFQMIFQKIDSLFDDYIIHWKTISEIQSFTNHKAGVDRVGTYLTDWIQRRNPSWQIEINEQEYVGNVICITMNPTSENRPISLSGHMDTANIRTFDKKEKIPVREDHENIYGLGVTDCKGGIIAGLLAMDALQACGFQERPVKLLLQSDEETSSRKSNKKTIDWICRKAKDSVAFFNLECHHRGQVCLSRNGSVTYRFKITGKEAHSATGQGANAIVDAAQRILALKDCFDNKKYIWNCGTIYGGTASNVVAASCIFHVNFRFSDSVQYDAIESHVKEIKEQEFIKGCSCDVEQISKRSEMPEKEINLQLLQKVNRILSESGLDEPILKKQFYKGSSDAGEVVANGIPCLDSLGVEGGKTHSVNEYAKKASLKTSAKRLAAIIYGWGWD